TNRHWSFGDTTTTNTTATSLVHIYSLGGTNTVILIASGTSGSSTKTNANYIRVTNAPPMAFFSGTPTNGVVPLTVTFTDTSTGTITNRNWDFGDTSITNVTVTNVVHTYSTVGTRNVRLIVK